MYLGRFCGMFFCLTVLLSQNGSIIRSAHSADAIICPKYWWMDWGSYKSWYALQYPDGADCTSSFPINYNSSASSTRNCENGDCIIVTGGGEAPPAARLAPPQKDDPIPSDAPAPPVANKKKSSAMPLTSDGHHVDSIKLPEIMTVMRTNKVYYDLFIDSHYTTQMGVNKTSRDLYSFDANVVNADGVIEMRKIYVIARHVYLKRVNDPPAGQEAYYPDPLVRNVGQEVTSTASENTVPGGAGRFTEVNNVTSIVELLGPNVVHLKVKQADSSWWIYHINTHTDIDSLP